MGVDHTAPTSGGLSTCVCQLPTNEQALTLAVEDAHIALWSSAASGDEDVLATVRDKF